MNTLPYKYESVQISNHVDDTLAIAVRDWIFSEDQEIEEHNQISGGQPRVRMAKQVSATTWFGASSFLFIASLVTCRLKCTIKVLLFFFPPFKINMSITT